MESTRKFGHSVSIPLPLIMLERAITLKCRIGLIRDQRLQPARNGLGRSDGAGSGGEQRIDEEAGQLGLKSRMREGGDHGPDADAGKHAQRRAAQQNNETPVERHIEHDLDHGRREQHHQEEQQKQRRDFRNDDFISTGGRHQQLFDGAGFALLHHRSGRHDRPVQDQQQTEYSGHDKP